MKLVGDGCSDPLKPSVRRGQFSFGRKMRANASSSDFDESTDNSERESRKRLAAAQQRRVRVFHPRRVRNAVNEHGVRRTAIRPRNKLGSHASTVVGARSSSLTSLGSTLAKARETNKNKERRFALSTRRASALDERRTCVPGVRGFGARPRGGSR